MKTARKARFSTSEEQGGSPPRLKLELQQHLDHLHHLLYSFPSSPPSASPPSPTTLLAFLDSSSKPCSPRSIQFKEDIRMISRLHSSHRRRLRKRQSRNEESARRARELLGGVVGELEELKRVYGVKEVPFDSIREPREEQHLVDSSRSEVKKRRGSHDKTAISPPSAPPPPLLNPTSPTLSALAAFAQLHTFPRSPQPPVLINGELWDHAVWASQRVAEQNEALMVAAEALGGGSAEHGYHCQLVVAYGEGGVVELLSIGESGELMTLWSAEGVEQVLVQDVRRGGGGAEMSLWWEREGGDREV
ncbi:hypothetical protein BCR35DRAFT_351764 [Leucosporidium creatinivorum]|uniref:Uncharacterized protein n=1 Tax=Leucosporidium creatinivorum TaxID=106004 RepID=A0A1Y2FMS7_9BASI|nr:hypothetical protein BCR35DRAFT_351764 [Leucosporidium creatinivorum]